MIQSFSAFFEKYCALSKQAKEAIDGISQKHNLPKNTMVLNQGEVCRSVFLISCGVARMFYYHNGNDITNRFFFDNEVIADMQSIYSKKPSLFQIQLLEDCQLIEIKYRELEKLYTRYHEIESIGRLLAIECFLEESEYSRLFQMFSSKHRYIQLLEKYPDIINRVSLGYIASYIGVTQVQLSRIRSQLVRF